MELPAALQRAMPFSRAEISVDGVRLSVVDDGPDDAPSTIVFLHGNPAWSYLWRNLIPPAIEAGHRVVAPDHAGFGASDKPRDPRYYSLRRHVDNLDAIGRELEWQNVTLVLHDWGGPIGMGWAVRNADRLRRIVVANTVAFPPKTKRSLSRWHNMFATPAGYTLGVAFNLIERTAMKHGVRRPLTPEATAAYAWPMKDKGGRIAAGRFVQLVPDGPDHETSIELESIWAQAPKIATVPTLVLWADRDPVFPPKWAERWKEAPLAIEAIRHVSAGGGHFWQEDDPEPFLREILAFTPADSTRK